MDIRDTIAHFRGVPALADALGVSRSAVYQWRNSQRIPLLRQYQIETLTSGTLRADRQNVNTKVYKPT